MSFNSLAAKGASSLSPLFSGILSW
jgi:hypothetical protein